MGEIGRSGCRRARRRHWLVGADQVTFCASTSYSATAAVVEVIIDLPAQADLFDRLVFDAMLEGFLAKPVGSTGLIGGMLKIRRLPASGDVCTRCRSLAPYCVDVVAQGEPSAASKTHRDERKRST